jgi:outer membrane receptor protein involved in Fe transport
MISIRPLGLLAAFAALLAAAVPSSAQSTSATVRGIVKDDTGGLPGASITAQETASGFSFSATSGADGSFTLAGLRPGPYDITVAMPQYKPAANKLTVLVGQNIDLDFRLTADLVYTENVTVVGEQAVDVKTSQVATNITAEQIRNLPQNDRNFLNFAALAPGVRVNAGSETTKEVTAGALPGFNTNVFIDGVSYKNDILLGGVVGQDSSRGNPFPQNAVQEFRVLTQNYSAEYQKASAAVITAVTRSGSNDFNGDVFAYYQDNDLVDDHPLSGAEQPFFERLQTGLSVGGPIIRDRMHFFVSYEGNDQDREEIVRLGGASVPAALRQQLSSYAGNFPSEFQSDLIFGKLSFQPGSSHLLDFSAFIRDETDVRGFGGETSFEAAERIDNDVMQAGLRHQFTGGSWLNEANLSYQTYTWNPQPNNPDLVGRNYFGLIRVGGRDTEQDFDQKRLALRDDVTMVPLQFSGSHAIKFGGLLEQSEYSVVKSQVGNPVYNFRSDENWEIPFEALYGLGDPEISGDNTAIGLYVQDDWSITDRLTANLGLRWDYESDMFAQDWVTPADAVAKFSSWVDADRYFTDGDDREPITDMFAPRLGLTFDVLGNNKTVVFGGWGRYYDRIVFNSTIDEQFRLQYKVGNFQFSRDGLPRGDGRPTVAWDPRYGTEAGLQELLATGRTGNPELFLLENDTQAPYSDQATLGVRQALGPIVATLSYGRTRSYNNMTFTWGHLNPDGTCCRWGEIGPLGYAAILVSNDDVRTWYDAIYLTVEKPFTSTSRWGGTLAYTNSDAEAIGGDLFSLDFPTLDQYPRRPILGIQEHRLVANAIVRLPFNINLGTIVNYGSGYPFDIIDRSAGTGPAERIRRGEGTGPDYLTVDLRLEYQIPISRFGVSLVGEAFNVTDDPVYNDFNREVFTLPAVNPNYGNPTSIVAGTQRRFQYGVRVTF